MLNWMVMWHQINKLHNHIREHRVFTVFLFFVYLQRIIKKFNMACFISAGHNPKGVKVDPGAVGNGYREADLTVEFRDLVIAECLKLGLKVISDRDDETLAQYLGRIKPGSGSVVLEFHFDAAASLTATGSTAIISGTPSQNSRNFAKELVNTTSNTLCIKNRGVITEADSHRGRLGLMRKEGIVALLEIGFISNKSDIEAYKKYKEELAKQVAKIVEKYELLID